MYKLKRSIPISLSRYFLLLWWVGVITLVLAFWTVIWKPPYLLSSVVCSNQYYNCSIRGTISLGHKTPYLRSGASFWTSQALLSWGSLWIGETNAHWLTLRSNASVNQWACFWYACSQELTCGPWGPLDPLFPIGPSWPCLKKSKTFLVSGIVKQQIFTDKSWF